jgi:hypothetical protein
MGGQMRRSVLDAAAAAKMIGCGAAQAVERKLLGGRAFTARAHIAHGAPMAFVGRRLSG